MVGPKAVQPPAASQTCSAHGIPGRKEQASTEAYTTELAKALDPIAKFPTIAFCVFWGAVLFVYFAGSIALRKTHPRGYACHFHAPLLAAKRTAALLAHTALTAASGVGGASQRCLSPLLPPHPPTPRWLHSQRQSILHGVEAMEALPVNQPVHGIVVYLQERL